MHFDHRLSSMTNNKNQHPFEMLAGLWTLHAKGQYLTGAGPYPWGAIAPCYTSIESAEAIAKDLTKNYPDQFVDLAPVQIGDPLAAMKKAASEGLCAFELTDPDFPYARFTFSVRVEEASRPLPTVLAAVRNGVGIEQVLSQAGILNLDCAEILPWKRFDVLDHVTARWGERRPFRSFKDGDSLWEIRSSDGVMTFPDFNLVGEYAPPEGCIGFFTARNNAAWFLENEIPKLNIMAFVDAGSQIDSPDDFRSSLGVYEIEDLSARLEELASLGPPLRFVINPADNRENSAWGWIRPTDFGSETFRNITSNVDGPWMRGVSGVWSIGRRNTLALVARAPLWNGIDTCYQPTGNEIQLAPLKRSLASQIDLPEPLKNADEMDAEAILQGLLATCTSDDARFIELKEAFVMSAWDSVTGVRETWPFQSPIDALLFLAAYEREHDRPTRTDGAQACFLVGFSGSRAPEWEASRGERFLSGLYRIGMRMLRRGYVPEDGSDIVALCNSVLSTLHLKFAGYAIDLCVACSEADRPTLIDELSADFHDVESEDESICDELSAGAARWDRQGEKLVVQRLGQSVWESLTDHSKLFLSTAVADFEQRGFAPQLDFSGVSIGVVKALEVELGNIFLRFFASFGGKIPAPRPDRWEEQSLVNNGEKGKAPALGEMAKLLKGAKRPDSEINDLLARFLAPLSGADYLLSKAFCDKALSKVIHRYRNGGAHDSAITYETCAACIRDLVGSEPGGGIIGKIVNVKRSMA